MSLLFNEKVCCKNWPLGKLKTSFQQLDIDNDFLKDKEVLKGKGKL